MATITTEVVRPASSYVWLARAVVLGALSVVAFGLLADAAGAEEGEAATQVSDPTADSVAVEGEAISIQESVFWTGPTSESQPDPPDPTPDVAQAEPSEPEHPAEEAEPHEAQTRPVARPETPVEISVVVDQRPRPEPSRVVAIDAPVRTVERPAPVLAPQRSVGSVGELDGNDAVWTQSPTLLHVRAGSVAAALDLLRESIDDLVADGLVSRDAIDGARYRYAILGPAGLVASGTAHGMADLAVQLVAASAAVSVPNPRRDVDRLVELVPVDAGCAPSGNSSDGVLGTRDLPAGPSMHVEWMTRGAARSCAGDDPDPSGSIFS